MGKYNNPEIKAKAKENFQKQNKEAFENMDTGSLLSSGIGLATTLATPSTLGNVSDTSVQKDAMGNIDNFNVSNINNFDALESVFGTAIGTDTTYDWKDWRPNEDQKMLGLLGETMSGAQSGMQFGSNFGPIGGGIGAIVGGAANLAKGAVAWKKGDEEAQARAQQLHSIGEQSKLNAINKIKNQSMNIAQSNKDNALLNIAAEGGYMHTGDFTNGITFFSEGGSHEENPYQGIQQGIAPDGKPNLVEEGEYKYKDYIYSKRLKVPKQDYEMLGLKEGKDYTYADAVEVIQKESEERPNDPISKRNLDAMMGRLQNSQETFKQKRDAMKMKREFEKLSPEEQAYMLQAMSQPQQAVPVQAQYAANGGHLYTGAGKLEFSTVKPTNVEEGKRIVRSKSAFGEDIYALVDATYKGDVYNAGTEENPDWVLGKKQNNGNINYATQALRATPVIGSAIGAIASLMDTPNYSNIERAENMYRQIPMVSPKPIGNRMSYTPMDINYLMTQIGNQNVANRRAIMESSAGNPGAVASALLASNYKGTTAMGEAFKQADEYNLKQRQLVDEFNRGTDMYNAEADFKGQVQNQQRANILADAFLKTGMLRDEELAKIQANKSASISSFLNNMGNLGTDMLNRDMVQALIDSGAYHSISDTMGKTGFKVANGGKLRKKGGKHA